MHMYIILQYNYTVHIIFDSPVDFWIIVLFINLYIRQYIIIWVLHDMKGKEECISWGGIAFEKNRQKTVN